MMKSFLLPLFVIFCFQSGIAQNITGKIIDSKTGESIPYANIRVNESNLVSNAEGFFTLSEANSSDSSVIFVSYLGFVTREMTIDELKRLQYIIRMEPGIVELENVQVTKPDPNTIMAEVRKNLERNYKNNWTGSKNMMFYRESTSFNPKIFDIEITKSTGFSKSALKSANSQLSGFTSGLISHPPLEFTDMLGNYYMARVKKNDKPVLLSKLDVIKATKLRNENRSASLEELETMATKILLQHMDSTKYYRVKSGLIGSRDTISLRKDFNKKKSKTKPTPLNTSKTSLGSFIYQNNFLPGTKMDFVGKPELYEYAYEGATYSNNNEFVYVISFKPRKSKAKYTGKLYISDTDFAIVRADYTLGDGKKLSGFNMKLLLGVKMAENLSNGTIIYKQNPTGEGYYLQYAAMETGQYFYVNRPLKFIELTDEEKDVVAFDLKVEGNSRDKMEFLNISRSEISEATFEQVKESDFNYIKLRRYDPSLWKDYSAIEPLEEMKQFKAVD